MVSAEVHCLVNYSAKYPCHKEELQVSLLLFQRGHEDAVPLSFALKSKLWLPNNSAKPRVIGKFRLDPATVFLLVHTGWDCCSLTDLLCVSRWCPVTFSNYSDLLLQDQVQVFYLNQCHYSCHPKCWPQRGCSTFNQQIPAQRKISSSKWKIYNKTGSPTPFCIWCMSWYQGFWAT